MVRSEYYTSVIYSRILVDMLAEMGFHPSRVLEETGIEPGAIADPDYKLSLGQQVALYQRAIKVSKLDGLGLLHGQRILPSHLGLMGYAIQTSANLQQAFRLLISYSQTVDSLASFALHSDGNVQRLLISNIPSSGEIRQYMAEEHLASINSVLGSITGGHFRASRICLDYPAPQGRALYRNIFRCPVEFSCDAIEYQFDASQMELEITLADPATARACEEKCEAILRKMDEAGDYTSNVRRSLLMLPCESRSLDAVASALRISPRSVRRKLAKEETTFQKVYDEVRLELAIKYLGETYLPLEEIAALLGFSEASNFRQAFRRWTGSPPSAYRQLG